MLIRSSARTTGHRHFAPRGPQVRGLVNEGRLVFANAGWCMHDEAASHFVDMIDNTAIGHRFLYTEIGPVAIPTAQWQVRRSVSAAGPSDALSARRVDWRSAAVGRGGTTGPIADQGAATPPASSPTHVAHPACLRSTPSATPRRTRACSPRRPLASPPSSSRAPTTRTRTRAARTSRRSGCGRRRRPSAPRARRWAASSLITSEQRVVARVACGLTFSPPPNELRSARVVAPPRLRRARATYPAAPRLRHAAPVAAIPRAASTTATTARPPSSTTSRWRTTTCPSAWTRSSRRRRPSPATRRATSCGRWSVGARGMGARGV